MPLLLSSPAIPPNGDIPWQYTCDGADISPPLAWSGLPKGTKSLVLVLLDPDAPGSTFHHWAAYDIAPSAHGLAGGYDANRVAVKFHEGRNDFGRIGYGGPCPPKGAGPHHYHFTLMAISRPALNLTGPASASAVIAAAAPYVIARAELVGTYRR